MQNTKKKKINHPVFFSFDRCSHCQRMTTVQITDNKKNLIRNNYNYPDSIDCLILFIRKNVGRSIDTNGRNITKNELIQEIKSIKNAKFVSLW